MIIAADESVDARVKIHTGLAHGSDVREGAVERVLCIQSSLHAICIVEGSGLFSHHDDPIKGWDEEGGIEGETRDPPGAALEGFSAVVRADASQEYCVVLLTQVRTKCDVGVKF